MAQLQAVIVVFATAVNSNLGLITPFRKRASIVRSKQWNISQWKTLVTTMSDIKTRADVCEWRKTSECRQIASGWHGLQRAKSQPAHCAIGMQTASKTIQAGYKE